MRVAMYYSNNDVRLEEMPVPLVEKKKDFWWVNPVKQIVVKC